jgi:hypothetical protein
VIVLAPVKNPIHAVHSPSGARAVIHHPDPASTVYLLIDRTGIFHISQGCDCLIGPGRAAKYLAEWYGNSSGHVQGLLNHLDPDHADQPACSAVLRKSPLLDTGKIIVDNQGLWHERTHGNFLSVDSGYVAAELADWFALVDA